MKMTREVIGDALVLNLEGEADLEALPTLQKEVRAIKDERVPLLMLDFSKATFVNTPVWALVVEYFQFTVESGCKLAVVGMKERVLASFEIVRLGAFIQHFETSEEAIAAFGG